MVVLLLLAIPVGLFVLYIENRQDKRNLDKLSQFVNDVKKRQISNQNKIDIIKEAYTSNNYILVSQDDSSVVVSYKSFSLGWLIFWFAFLMIGSVAYVLYYLYMQKSMIIEISLVE
jgi:hypothetical protein